MGGGRVTTIKRGHYATFAPYALVGAIACRRGPFTADDLVTECEVSKSAVMRHLYMMEHFNLVERLYTGRGGRGKQDPSQWQSLLAVRKP
jgi:hypothetical protein